MDDVKRISEAYRHSADESLGRYLVRVAGPDNISRFSDGQLADMCELYNLRAEEKHGEHSWAPFCVGRGTE